MRITANFISLRTRIWLSSAHEEQRIRRIATLEDGARRHGRVIENTAVRETFGYTHTG